MISLTTFRNIGIILSAFLSPVLTDTSNMEPRVVGGKVASIYKFPSSVFLDVECEDGDTWGCGASVLNQRIVLTAAHCLDIQDKGQILAIAGHQNIEKSDTVIEVNRYTIHKNYDKWLSHNDIGLGYLKRSLRLGRNIQRVFITKEFPTTGKSEKLFVAGWGIVNDDVLEPSMILKSVDQTLTTRAYCRKIVSHLKNGMMCASKNIKNRPARGDSGSALLTSNMQQLGLVSFRTREVVEVLVYMNISFYYDWILAESEKLRCRIK